MRSSILRVIQAGAVVVATALVLSVAAPAHAGVTNTLENNQWLTSSPHSYMSSTCIQWPNMYIAAGDYQWKVYIGGTNFDWTKAINGRISLGTDYYDVFACIDPREGTYDVVASISPHNPCCHTIVVSLTDIVLPFDGLYTWGTSLRPLDW